MIATGGAGEGAYRIAAGLDFAAREAVSEAAHRIQRDHDVLHLILFQNARLPGIHGAPWGRERFGEASADSFVHAVTRAEPTVVRQNSRQATSSLTTHGRARGILLGGNHEMVATSAGWALPSLSGRILLLEAVGQWLGALDRQLTMLLEAGYLDGLAGVAVGQYEHCGRPDPGPMIGRSSMYYATGWRGPAVPVLGGLPIGHGAGALAVPVRTGGDRCRRRNADTRSRSEVADRDIRCRCRVNKPKATETAAPQLRPGQAADELADVSSASAA